MKEDQIARAEIEASEKRYKLLAEAIPQVSRFVIIAIESAPFSKSGLWLGYK